METPDLVNEVRTDPSASRVFGEPYETVDGATIVTVARIRGGGRGFTATPVGAFVVHDGKVSWEAAVDETRVGLLAVSIGLAATVIATLAVLRRPPWPDLSRRGSFGSNRSRP